LTDSILSSLNLSERQRQAIAFARLEGRITNAGHQKLTGGSRRTALRELDALVQFGILDPKGKGHGAPLCLGKNETRHKCANSQTEHKAAKGNMNCIVPNLQTSPDFSRPNPS